MKPKRIANFSARLMAAGIAMGVLASPAAAEVPADPFQSVMWRDIAERYLPGGQIVMDDRVKVTVPEIVEQQTQVPITADARALGGVTELVVLADLNPIPHVLTLRPLAAAPYVSVRIKVEQATAVRAAAKTNDGVWHIGSTFLVATGGGCSAPAAGRATSNWSDLVGQTQGKVWRESDGLARVRLRVRHPMDTGLARDNTPAFYIDKVALSGARGEALLEIETFEPVSEDPALTVLVALPAGEAGVTAVAHDNNGGVYRSFLPAPWRQSEFVAPPETR